MDPPRGYFENRDERNCARDNMIPPATHIPLANETNLSSLNKNTTKEGPGNDRYVGDNLPFLVTHWLRNLGPASTNLSLNNTKKNAIEHIIEDELPNKGINYARDESKPGSANISTTTQQDNSTLCGIFPHSHHQEEEKKQSANLKIDSNKNSQHTSEETIKQYSSFIPPSNDFETAHLARIHHLANELSNAFASLGAYGVSIRVSIKVKCFPNV